MLKRKIISVLNKWKDNSCKEALLLKGARQIGKTTAVREFARQNYTHFVEINFEQNPEAKEAFAGSRDARTIINRLSLMGYGPFVVGKTLVFFDEIQSCPNARTSIKFLVEDNQFDYIESGSLLGINYAEVSSYPVGFEFQVEMFPLDFEEWLWANGISDEVIQEVKNNFIKGMEIDAVTHNQLMKLYRSFLIVGGMPKVVTTYLKHVDFAEVIRQQRLIIDSYRDDIAKYAANQKTRAKRFFDAIPSQIAKQHKRFMLSDLEKTGNMQKYEDAAQWLADSGIAYFSYNTHTLAMPFEQYENRNLFKVYLLDTGLLCSLWGENLQWKVMNGDIAINEGGLTENFVASELVKHGHQLHYYDKKSRNELDFLIRENNLLSVIEVKSGNDYKKHSALNNVMDEFSEYIERCLVLSKFNVDKSDIIQYSPIYTSMWL